MGISLRSESRDFGAQLIIRYAWTSIRSRLVPLPVFTASPRFHTNCFPQSMKKAPSCELQDGAKDIRWESDGPHGQFLRDRLPGSAVGIGNGMSWESESRDFGANRMVCKFRFQDPCASDRSRFSTVNTRFYENRLFLSKYKKSPVPRKAEQGWEDDSRRRATLPRANPAVPSPKRPFTSVFGMGTGVTSSPWPPGKTVPTDVGKENIVLGRTATHPVRFGSS